MTQQSHKISFAQVLPGRLLFALIAIGNSAPALGQGDSTTASLSTSLSPHQPGDLVLSNSEKGITRTTQPYSKGGYSFGLLPPSTLTVEAKEFKGYEQTGIRLGV